MQKKKLFLTMLLTLCLFIPTQNTSNVFALDSTINTNTINITFTNASDISINMQGIHIIDTTNNSGSLLTISLDDFSTQTTLFYDTDDSPIIPGHLSSNYSPNIIVSGDNVTSIHSVSPTDLNSTTLTNKYFNNLDTNISSSFSSIIDICTTLNGDIFVLDNNGIIAKKDFNSNKFILFYDLSQSSITPNINTKLCVSLDCSIILLSHDNTIYNVSTSGINTTNYNLPTTTNIKAMLLDHHNHLFILDNNQLIRSSINSHDIVVLDATLNDSINFCINYNEGIAYFLTPTSLISTTITFAGSNFFHTLNQQSSAIDISTITPSLPLNILSPKTDNIILYEFPNLISKLDTISIHTTMILLDHTNDNFYYVLLNNLNKNNTLGYVKKNDVNLNTSNTTTTTYRLLLDNTPIYTLPTSLNINNNSRITCTLNKYTDGEYTILTSINSPTPPTDYNNITFIPVTFTLNDITMFGYVDSHRVIPIELTGLASTFITNATTRQEITVFADKELNTQSVSLPKDTKVFVVQTTNDICLIEWLENNTLHSGYVSHRYINDGKLSNAQLIGLIAMAVTLIVSITLIAIINKRKRNIKDVNDEE